MRSYPSLPHTSAGHAPVFGRRLVVDVVAQGWSLAGRGRGQAVLLVGDSGIGKSAALAAAAATLRAAGALVVDGRGPSDELATGLAAPGGGAALDPSRVPGSRTTLPTFGSLLRGLWSQTTTANRRRCEGAKMRLAPLLGEELTSGDDCALRFPPVVPLPATSTAHRLWPLGSPLVGLGEALVELIAATTSETPQVWLLDDLASLADASATSALSPAHVQELLAYLLPALGELPILLLGSLTVEEDGRLPVGPLGALLDAPRLPRSVARIDLGPLDLAAVRSWVEQRLGPERAQVAVHDIYARTGGRPRKLAELLATLAPDPHARRPQPVAKVVPVPVGPAPVPGPAAVALWEPTVRGALLRREGKPEAAALELEQALTALSAIESDLVMVAGGTIRSQLTAVRALTLVELAQLPQTAHRISRLHEAITLCTQIGLVTPLAEVYLMLGDLARAEGRWDRARAAWARCARLAMCRGDDGYELDARLRLARLAVHECMGVEEPAALELLSRVESLAQSPALSGWQAVVELTLADYALVQGNVDVAARRLDRAAQLLDATALDGLGVEPTDARRGERVTIARMRCELLAAQGQHQAALDLALDVLREARRSDNALDTALLYVAAAALLRQASDPESAKWFIAEGKQFARVDGAGYAEARLMIEEALLHSIGGERAAALDLLSAAAAQFERLGARRDYQRAVGLHRQLYADFTPKPLPRLGGANGGAVDDSDELPRRPTPPVDGSRGESTRGDGARSDGARSDGARDDGSRGDGSRGGGALSLSEERAVVDVARATAWIFNVDQLLDVVLDKALQLTQFQRGFVLLLDEQRHPIVRHWRKAQDPATSPVASIDDDGTPRQLEVVSGAAAPTMSFSSSTVRRVMETGQGLAVMDVDDDPALRAQESILSLRLRAVMCVPMRLAGRIIGIVYIDTRRVGRDHRFPELTLLEALAGQAAISIEHARLLAEEQRKTEHMNVVAHELRNPLSAILAFSEQFARSTVPQSPASTADAFARIHRQGKRLSRLVDNLLQLGRMQSAAVEWNLAPVSLEAIVGEIVQLYTPLAERRSLKLTTRLQDHLPLTYANADRLMQVVMNLLGNAFKFTPKGGAITLSAQTEQVASEVGPSTWLRVDVADTGPGIAPELLGQLFHKFVRGSERRRSLDAAPPEPTTGEQIVGDQGAGLGLYICREIIQRHGGTIWAESPPGSGARLSFRIPALPKAQP